MNHISFRNFHYEAAVGPSEHSYACPCDHRKEIDKERSKKKTEEKEKATVEYLGEKSEEAGGVEQGRGSQGINFQHPQGQLTIREFIEPAGAGS